MLFQNMNPNYVIEMKKTGINTYSIINEITVNADRILDFLIKVISNHNAHRFIKSVSQ